MVADEGLEPRQADDDSDKIFCFKTYYTPSDPSSLFSPYRHRPLGTTSAYSAEAASPVATSTPLHDFAYHTIAFPVSWAGGDARAMRGQRQASPTPRGSGKRDPKGGLPRPPDVVARRL